MNYGIDTKYSFEVANHLARYNKDLLRILHNAIKRTPEEHFLKGYVVMSEEEVQEFRQDNVEIGDIESIPFQPNNQKYKKSVNEFVQRYYMYKPFTDGRNPFDIGQDNISEEQVPEKLRGLVKTYSEKYIFPVDDALKPLSLATNR